MADLTKTLSDSVGVTDLGDTLALTDIATPSTTVPIGEWGWGDTVWDDDL